MELLNNAVFLRNTFCPVIHCGYGFSLGLVSNNQLLPFGIFGSSRTQHRFMNPGLSRVSSNSSSIWRNVLRKSATLWWKSLMNAKSAFADAIECWALYLQQRV